MQSSVGVRERIDHVYPSLRPAEQAVARYVRSHLDEAAGLTVGQLAEVSRVSQPTVIRFARRLASADTVSCDTCCATRRRNAR